MKDSLANAIRSNTMRAIRSSGNRSTELRLKGAFARLGIRGWRVRDRTVLGVPDFVFPKARLAVFVDGCFWHGCPICNIRVPQHNRSYWITKIARNKSRDRAVQRALGRQGWTVVRVWEHELRESPLGCIQKIVTASRSIGSGEKGTDSSPRSRATRYRTGR
jgi:DNA mismatch endonuclease (patch repair protein)